VSREELPRIYELWKQSYEASDAYDFEIKDDPSQAKHLRDIESELQGLDVASWERLKCDLIPLITKRDARRDWQPLLDKLNEAKGYNYLVRIGCTEVEFIPRSLTKGQQTPDLHGRFGSARVLCEVKTINISEAERAFREGGVVRSILTRLPPEFFNKLKSTLETAKNQMATYYPTATEIRQIVYVIINYDDVLHEYARDYATQLEAFIATKPVPDLEIAFDIKPPFYWATA
jgi:hypothetical protein